MNPRGFTAGKPNKLWWIPLHDPSHERDVLVIRGARIDSAATPADTSRFINRELVWPITADIQVNRSGAYFMGFEMPSQGTWLLVATSGSGAAIATPPG